MRAYNDDGDPLSDATKLSDLSKIQDLAAEAMQRFAPEIERGHKKKERLKAGADLATLASTQRVSCRSRKLMLHQQHGKPSTSA